MPQTPRLWWINTFIMEMYCWSTRIILIFLLVIKLLLTMSLKYSLDCFTILQLYYQWWWEYLENLKMISKSFIGCSGRKVTAFHTSLKNLHFVIFNVYPFNNVENGHIYHRKSNTMPHYLSLSSSRNHLMRKVYNAKVSI